MLSFQVQHDFNLCNLVFFLSEGTISYIFGLAAPSNREEAEEWDLLNELMNQSITTQFAEQHLDWPTSVKYFQFESIVSSHMFAGPLSPGVVLQLNIVFVIPFITMAKSNMY